MLFTLIHSANLLAALEHPFPRRLVWALDLGDSAPCACLGLPVASAWFHLCWRCAFCPWCREEFRTLLRIALATRAVPAQGGLKGRLESSAVGERLWPLLLRAEPGRRSPDGQRRPRVATPGNCGFGVSGGSPTQLVAATACHRPCSDCAWQYGALCIGRPRTNQ